MKTFTFRQYKKSPKEDSNSPDGGNNNEPKSKDSAAYQKRREQVRRAQRTHRERKETYTKQLEAEVLQLRNTESHLMLKVHSYEQEVSRLQALLDQYGIPHEKELDWLAALPPVLPQQQQQEMTAAGGVDMMLTGSSIKMARNPLGKQQLHIDSRNDLGRSLWLTDYEGSVGESSGGGSLARKRSFFRSRKVAEDTGLNCPTFEPSQGYTAAPFSQKVKDLEQTELGMEFVLTLEAPCLHHIQEELSDGTNHPSCHTFTATASLLHHSSSQLAGVSDQNEWTVPYAALENLLRLSEKLDLDYGYLAPIQIWARLREIWGFGDMDLVKLKWLTKEMLKKLQCRGFGTVIDEETFTRLVSTALPGGVAF